MNSFLFFMCVVLIIIAGVALGAAVHAKKQYDDILQNDIGHLCLNYLKLDQAKYYNGKYDEID